MKFPVFVIPLLRKLVEMPLYVSRCEIEDIDTA